MLWSLLGRPQIHSSECLQSLRRTTVTTKICLRKGCFTSFTMKFNRLLELKFSLQKIKHLITIYKRSIVATALLVCTMWWLIRDAHIGLGGSERPSISCIWVPMTPWDNGKAGTFTWIHLEAWGRFVKSAHRVIRNTRCFLPLRVFSGREKKHFAELHIYDMRFQKWEFGLGKAVFDPL